MKISKYSFGVTKDKVTDLVTEGKDGAGSLRREAPDDARPPLRIPRVMHKGYGGDGI